MPPSDDTKPHQRSTTLYIVRHGETEFNRRGIVQGHKIDSILNSRGMEQAHALGRRLGTVAFDAVYASTLRRALQTAHIVARYQSPAPGVRSTADLAEMSWGVFEGRSIEEEDVIAGLSAVKAAWARGLFNQPVAEGESVVQVLERGRRALLEIVDRHTGETVLVVTHGRFIRIVLAGLLDDFALDRMDEIEHSNTGINVIAHEDGSFAHRVLNDTAHLNGATGGRSAP